MACQSRLQRGGAAVLVAVLLAVALAAEAVAGPALSPQPQQLKWGAGRLALRSASNRSRARNCVARLGLFRPAIASATLP